MRVLLVEDEAKVSNFVARGLTAERRSTPKYESPALRVKALAALLKCGALLHLS